MEIIEMKNNPQIFLIEWIGQWQNGRDRIE